MGLTVKVYYDNKFKDLKIEDNLAIKINNTNYQVKNGKLFINGKMAKNNNMNLSHEAAYQLLGMSNNDSTDGNYSLTKKDLEKAKKDYEYDQGWSQAGEDRFALRCKMLIGLDAGKHYTDTSHNYYKNGIFHTEVQPFKGGQTSKVSIWSAK